MENLTKKLNVGIDAKWFFNGPPSGKMVVKNLVDEIILNNCGRFNLFLFISSKFSRQAYAYFPSDVKIILMPNIPNLLSNLLLVPFLAVHYKIDTILFQNFTCNWPGKLHKITYIHDVLFIDYPQYFLKYERFYFKQMKRLAANANKIIAISAYEKGRLIANKFAIDSQIRVVYHGISDGFRPQADYTREEISRVVENYHLPARYLLFVGRLNVRKNLANLIKALSLLEDAGIRLLIAGEKSDMYADLETMITEMKAGGRIIFTGHLPERDLQVVYACATIFCFPSFAEGFGLPPLEAMKSGVPVITSDRTAMPEVCNDAAIYVDPHDPYDIACKINLLLNDAALYKTQVKKGIERAANFVWARSAKQILTIIEETSAN